MEKKQQVLPQEFLQKVIDKLEEVGANLPCPRCGGEDFQIENGLVLHILQHSVNTFYTFGPGVICVLAACKRCGYVAEHSLEELGLIEEARKYASEIED